jgi:hypothetical protein
VLVRNFKIVKREMRIYETRPRMEKNAEKTQGWGGSAYPQDKYAER